MIKFPPHKPPKITLGVMLDCVKSCHYHMHELMHICKNLDWDTSISVVNTIIVISIDYCNALLYWVPEITQGTPASPNYWVIFIGFWSVPSLRKLLSVKDFSHKLHSNWAISLFRPYIKGFGVCPHANHAPKLWTHLYMLCMISHCFSQGPEDSLLQPITKSPP